ncbi:RNA-directed DNA polymerase [Catellatospora methionotrophica]|uniref:RNA-directed DNA polymerase n=1 Tax=Catellatospora methionotrophica TaxID=121620 RepID=UPI00140C7A9E|nr:RNA-directed DNA polymerase [Catellatospora methionotrophica]
MFPYPIENHVFHDRANEISDLIEKMSVDFNGSLDRIPLASYSCLAPIGYTGYRWATPIDPLWNAYLLSLVLSLAPKIEAARIDPAEQTVFSYRYDDTSLSGVFEIDGWGKFQERCYELASQHAYIVSVDIADFYSRIYHHRLDNALREVDDSGLTRTKQIIAILTKLSNGTSYGLPVGGNAARLLSELVLNRVDRLLMADPHLGEFCRYADDYRFFVKDLQSAHRCIGMLSEKLMRNEGFSLQKAKTRIMTSAEYQLVTEPNQIAEPGGPGKFLGLRLHFDPYSTTAVEDYERMMAQVAEFDILGLLREEITKGRVHVALTKKLVGALRYLDESSRIQAVVSLLDNIDTLAPVVPQVMLSIRQCLDDTRDIGAINSIHRAIRQLITDGHYIAKNDLNLSYMVRVLASHHSVENERLLIRLYDEPHGYGTQSAPNIQRDVMLTLAKWDVRYWLSERKHSFGVDHAWVRRAFRLSSYRLGDEGRHWRGANRVPVDTLDAIAQDWAAARSASPAWVIPV